jgi:hypothetical protein
MWSKLVTMTPEERAAKRREQYRTDPDVRARRLRQGRSPEENREYMSSYYAKNKERLDSQQRARRQDPEARARRNELRRARYAADPEYRQRCRASAVENPTAKREAKLRRKYGIGSAEFDQLLSEQNGGCAICHAEVADSRAHQLHVDHCHTTGRVRGILCGPCNRGIGMFRDDPALLIKAAEYLTEREK